MTLARERERERMNNDCCMCVCACMSSWRNLSPDNLILEASEMLLSKIYSHFCHSPWQTHSTMPSASLEINRRVFYDAAKCCKLLVYCHIQNFASLDKWRSLDELDLILEKKLWRINHWINLLFYHLLGDKVLEFLY